MGTIRFSEEQIKTLLENPNVEGCSEKSIKYSKDFKVTAIKKQKFTQPRVEVYALGEKKPKNCLFRWRSIFNKKGEKGLMTDNRGKSKSGGRPKKKWSNNRERIKYLETEIDYLKAENDFLAKLRKKR